MMKMVGVAVAATALALAGAAHAAEKPQGIYLKAETGWSFAGNAKIKSDDFDGNKADDIGDSALFGVGVGYRISPMFRTDLTLTYRGGFSLDDKIATHSAESDISSYATMLNGYFDIPVELGRFKPYVGAGLGWAHNEGDDFKDTTAGFSSKGGDSDSFAWQLMLGTGVTLTDSLTLDVGYRYFDGGKIKWPAGPQTNGGTFAGAKGDLAAHEVTLGLRYAF